MKFACIIILISSSIIIATPATACDWSPEPIKVSEFVHGKTIFWGRATELKWNKGIGLKNSKGLSFEPDIYYTVEVIKPLQGKMKKTVKVWSDNSSCGSTFGVGSVNLYVTSPYKNGDLYTDQLLSNYVSSISIVAFLEKNLDLSIANQMWYGHLDKVYESKCSENISENKEFSGENCKAILEYSKNSYETFERSREEAITLSQEKPWWVFWRL